MLRRWLELRRWRQQVNPGDFVSVRHTPTEYKVHVVEDKEVTIWDPFKGEYETYPLKKVYPPKK